MLWLAQARPRPGPALDGRRDGRDARRSARDGARRRGAGRRRLGRPGYGVPARDDPFQGGWMFDGPRIRLMAIPGWGSACAGRVSRPALGRRSLTPRDGAGARVLGPIGPCAASRGCWRRPTGSRASASSGQRPRNSAGRRRSRLWGLRALALDLRGDDRGQVRRVLVLVCVRFPGAAQSVDHSFGKLQWAVAGAGRTFGKLSAFQAKITEAAGP